MVRDAITRGPTARSLLLKFVEQHEAREAAKQALEAKKAVEGEDVASFSLGRRQGAALSGHEGRRPDQVGGLMQVTARLSGSGHQGALRLFLHRVCDCGLSLRTPCIYRHASFARRVPMEARIRWLLDWHKLL
jgi:hypothetical protein